MVMFGDRQGNVQSFNGWQAGLVKCARDFSSSIYNSSDRVQVRQDGENLFVVFRGTKRIRDLVTDLDVTGIPSSLFCGKVHSGILLRYKEYRDTMFRLILNSDFSHTRRLVFTGHSLGGAQALLARLDFAQNRGAFLPRGHDLLSCHAITFAAPNCGDSVFAASYYQLVVGLLNDHLRCTGDVISKSLNNVFDEVKGQGSSGGYWQFSWMNEGNDISHNHGVDAAYRPRVESMNGCAMSCPELPLAVVVGGYRIQFGTGAGHHFSRRTEIVDRETYGSVPLIGEILSGARTVVLKGQPGCFVGRDGKKFPTDCAESITANGSVLVNVDEAEYYFNMQYGFELRRVKCR